MSRTQFGLTTMAVEIAAVRSKNEFFEVPFSPKRSLLKIKIKIFQKFYLLSKQWVMNKEQQKIAKFSTQNCPLI
jgi:hypothetical protein